LVVAIVPTAPTDRASFSPPGDDALQVVPAETFESAPSDPTPAADAGAYGGLYPTFADPVPVTGSDVSGALVTPPTTAVARPAVPRRARPITLIKPDIYSKTGQLLAIGLLLAALVAYVRGYGLLGGRLLEP
jgi:hypothetical protein